MDGLLHNFGSAAGLSEAAPLGSSASTGTAIDAGSPVIERIYLGAVAARTRILGVVSCAAGDNRRELARALAARGAMAGDRTLLLDLGQPVGASPQSAPWIPGDGRAALSVARDPMGFDSLAAAGGPVSAMRLRNLDGLRHLLDVEFEHYRTIIVDAGEITNGAGAVVPTATAVQICDSAVLLAAPNRIGRHDFEQAIDAMGSTRSRIAGVVIDDTADPTVGEEMCLLVRRARARLPRLAGFLERRLIRNRLLWATL